MGIVQMPFVVIIKYLVSLADQLEFGIGCLSFRLGDLVWVIGESCLTNVSLSAAS